MPETNIDPILNSPPKRTLVSRPQAPLGTVSRLVGMNS
jgi:hypothetical protein